MSPHIGELGLWLRMLEEEHGGLRKAAAYCGLDPGYWSRLRSGEMDSPSQDVLERLGLRKVCTLYARWSPPFKGTL